VDEAGLPSFYFSLWFGLWAPKGTPRDVIGRLNAAVVDTLAEPAIHQKIAEQSMELPPSAPRTPAGLGAFHRAEIDEWWSIIKAAGLKGE
jgi:tripartite-type tricarboxylate transporter receptor subunit TctC